MSRKKRIWYPKMVPVTVNIETGISWTDRLLIIRASSITGAESRHRLYVC